MWASHTTQGGCFKQSLLSAPTTTVFKNVSDINTVLKGIVHCFAKVEFGCSVFHRTNPIIDMFNYPVSDSTILLRQTQQALADRKINTGDIPVTCFLHISFTGTNTVMLEFDTAIVKQISC